MKRRIAILGAGPTGLEAALYARHLGYSVSVYERGHRVADNVRRWGFVKLFTPWQLNASSLGLAILREAGLERPRQDASPTGFELTDQYLEPIAQSLGADLLTNTEVLGVSKVGMLKGENIGGGRRSHLPFRLLLRNQSGESEATADIVLDTTGVYATPVSLGDGGLPAVGERVLHQHIHYHLADVLGKQRDLFSGRRTLLVGAGFSAATALLELVRLAGQEPATEIVWARRSTSPTPFPTYSDDPLPLRAQLATLGNQIAQIPPSCCRVRPGVTVRAIEAGENGLLVHFTPVEGDGRAESVEVDHIVSHCGYRPDLDLSRELQVHQCYATEGPMKLAASLLASSGGGGDCLQQESLGAETLTTPEPFFFVLGHKSYGRRADYLMQVGREQIRDVFRLLEDEPELDLYAGDRPANMRFEQGA